MSPASLKVYSPGHDITHYDRECLLDCLRASDIVILNADEAQVLSHVLAMPVADIPENMSLTALVETRGPTGSAAYTCDRSYSITAVRPGWCLTARALAMRSPRGLYGD